MSSTKEMVDTVKAAVELGKENGVEKLTLSWEQWIGGDRRLHHAITVTYVEPLNCEKPLDK